MHFLLSGFYWALVSLHIVGGARLFQRVFPRESPWFGFVVPALVFILTFNFIEHLVALPVLVWMLPFTTVACLFLVLDSGSGWRGLKLPTGIFVAAFAVTLTLRLVKPSIMGVSSGNYDLPVISTFCMGHKLPAPFAWFPPYPVNQYYTLIHYGASVLTRLLGTDVGTGFNLGTALLSAWIIFAAAAIAWRVSRRRVWVTILAAITIQCASNGVSPLLWLEHWPVNPCTAGNILNDLDAPEFHPLLKAVLWPVSDYYSRRDLEVPGFWSWDGAFHATSGGQFLTLFSVWSLAELLRRRRSNWPWILFIVTPALMLVTSTWGVPLVGLFMVVGLAVALWRGIRPENVRMVIALLAAFTVLLMPVLSEFLPSEISIWRFPTAGEDHTQFLEFLLYWWPVVVLWIAVLFVWRRVGSLVRIVWILFPFFFWAVEDYTVAARFDMTGKLWGYLWGFAWCALFPAVAVRRARGFRLVLLLLVTTNAISLVEWVHWTYLTCAGPGVIGHLDGQPTYADDAEKRAIFDAMRPYKGRIFLAGLPKIYNVDGGMLAAFTRNYAFVDSSFYVDGFFCPNGADLATRRTDAAIAFYAGKMDDPLAFVRQHDIEGIVVWPDDNLPDERIAEFKQKLAPLYEYTDFRTSNGPNAGIFRYRGPER